MSDTPFMPLWVSDFVGDTLDLDAKEVGAYMLILMTMWGRDGYLPNDLKKLQRVARCGRDWPRVWDAIQHYFTVDGDNITQKRLLKERKNVARKREVNAQSGALGGRAKALKTKKAGLANASVSPKQPEPYPEPYTERKKEPPLSPKGEGFDEFWSIVPKKVGKGAAEKAWAKAVKEADAETIIAGMRRYASERRGKDQQYTAHPATWLNGKRWTDEAPATARSFHDMISQALENQTDAISGPREDHHKAPQRLSGPLQDAGSSGRPWGAERDRGHGGGDERAYPDVIRPRRFGGTDF